MISVIYTGYALLPAGIFQFVQILDIDLPILISQFFDRARICRILIRDNSIYSYAVGILQDVFRRGVNSEKQ